MKITNIIDVCLGVAAIKINSASMAIRVGRVLLNLAAGKSKLRANVPLARSVTVQVAKMMVSPNAPRKICRAVVRKKAMTQRLTAVSYTHLTLPTTSRV